MNQVRTGILSGIELKTIYVTYVHAKRKKLAPYQFCCPSQVPRFVADHKLYPSLPPISLFPHGSHILFPPPHPFVSATNFQRHSLEPCQQHPSRKQLGNCHSPAHSPIQTPSLTSSFVTDHLLWSPLLLSLNYQGTMRFVVRHTAFLPPIFTHTSTQHTHTHTPLHNSNPPSSLAPHTNT